jgi:hypothetical protein
MAATRRAYLVLCQSWAYDDQWWTGDDVPVMAFSDRAQAEAYLARCEEDDRLWQLENEGAQVETRYKVLEMDVEEDEAAT